MDKLSDLQEYVEDELPGRPGQHVQSGDVYFWAQGKISLGHKIGKGGAKYLYVEVGQTISLNRDPPSVKMETYASFWFNGAGDDPPFASKRHTNYPSEAKAMSALGECLKEALKQAIQVAPAEQRRALGQFRVPNMKAKLTVV